LLLKHVQHAYANAIREFKTSRLTEILEECIMEHQPPLARGRRIKLRYAHQGGKNPPRIIIHGNQTDAVPESYKRFLIGRFRKTLQLKGTPLIVEFRTGKNPYEGVKNKLTDRQISKRRRLMQHVKKGKKKN
jgi:GTP-binding protein